MENLNTNTIHDLAQSFADDLNYEHEAKRAMEAQEAFGYFLGELTDGIYEDIYFRLKDYFAEFDVFVSPADDDVSEIVNTITEKIIETMNKQ